MHIHTLLRHALLPVVVGICGLAVTGCGDGAATAQSVAAPRATVTVTPPTVTATATVTETPPTATVTVTAEPEADTGAPVASSDGPTDEATASPGRWFSTNRLLIQALLADGERLAGEAAEASDQPRQLLGISTEMATVADALNELGMDSPIHDLTSALWDLSDAERSMSNATEFLATASRQGNLVGMHLANEDVESARQEMARALDAYAATSAKFE